MYYRYIYLLLIISFSNFVSAQSGKDKEVDPNGYNVFYYDNGRISSEGYLKEGQPEGYWKTFYETGILKSEGYRKDFLLDSTWRFFNREGTLINVINYRGDKKNGYRHYS